MDQAESLKANTMIGKAQAMMDEQEDDVKQMNSMMLYSKVVTIRDQQLNENKRLEKEWFGEQRRLDTMMEIERLKDLQAQ
jgi:predicted metal-dependent TIM-barrel fold hydrolase